MAELEITITGPTGSGKTTLASWLAHHLQGRASSGIDGCAVYADEDMMLDLRRAEVQLSAVMARTKVTIKTVQVSRKEWVERQLPPRDCPQCDYPRSCHASEYEADRTDGCDLTQEELSG